MYENRTLVSGDNLEEMRNSPDECIDLIATEEKAELLKLRICLRHY